MQLILPGAYEHHTGTSNYHLLVDPILCRTWCLQNVPYKVSHMFAPTSLGSQSVALVTHRQFQTRASPGIAQVKFCQLWLLLTQTHSSSAACVAYPGNLAALKLPMLLQQVDS